MKTIILFLTVITISFGQVKIDNNQIVWRSIEQYDGDSETLMKKLKTLGKFENLELLDDSIVGRFVDVSFIYNGAASMYIMASKLNGSFVIQFKDKRYRISVSNLQLKSQTNTGVFELGSLENIEKYAIDKKGNLKKRFKSKDIPILESSLTWLFLLSNDNDW